MRKKASGLAAAATAWLAMSGFDANGESMGVVRRDDVVEETMELPELALREPTFEQIDDYLDGQEAARKAEDAMREIAGGIAMLQKKWSVAPATNVDKAFVATARRAVKTKCNGKVKKYELLEEVRWAAKEARLAKQKERHRRAYFLDELESANAYEARRIARREHKLGKIPGLLDLGVEQSQNIPVAATTPEDVERFEGMKIKPTKKPRAQRKLEESRRRFFVEDPRFHEGSQCEFCAMQLSHDRLGQQVLVEILRREGYEVTYDKGVVHIQSVREVNWPVIRAGMVELAA